jgi:hypothetical protein
MKEGPVTKFVYLVIVSAQALLGGLVALAQNDPPDATGASGGTRTAGDLLRLDDLFTAAGKPVTVLVTPHTDGSWHFRPGPEMNGAVAQVPMNNGIVAEMVGRQKKGEREADVTYTFETTLKGDNISFTVLQLPTGRIAPVILSERRYGGCFRVVAEMPGGGHSTLYLVKEQEETKKGPNMLGKQTEKRDLTQSVVETPDRRAVTQDRESLLPTFATELKGVNEVRVKNPNDFSVTAGLRQGAAGRDFRVPANGTSSVFVPDGRYDIYFVYSDKPDALFQGDSFTLNRNGVEIQIVKVVNGNYGIRQVK